MALIRQLLWLAVFVISTLSFVVLFENGTTNFGPNVIEKVKELQKFASEQINPPKKEQKAP
ncbi:MAG: hypothetical protein WCP06_01380 [Verrucomicrobiota bacterium]